MIGFLADKNIDVNAAIKKWEQEGICISREELFSDFQEPTKGGGGKDLREVYKPHEEQRFQQKYKQWKKTVLSRFKDGHFSFIRQMRELINYATTYLAQNQKQDNNFSERDTLYSYNLARELLNEPTAKTIEEVDASWIHRQDYIFFKQEQLENLQSRILIL